MELELLQPVQTVSDSVWTRDLVCTVGEVKGLKALNFNTVNLANTGTKIFVDLVLESGATQRVFCSGAVSAMLREKKIKRNHLLGFPLMKVTNTETGAKSYAIQQPNSEGNTVSFAVADMEAEEYVAPRTNWEELIA